MNATVQLAIFTLECPVGVQGNIVAAADIKVQHGHHLPLVLKSETESGAEIARSVMDTCIVYYALLLNTIQALG